MRIYDPTITGHTIPQSAEELKNLDSCQLAMYLIRDAMIKEEGQLRLQAIGQHVRMMQTNIAAEKQAFSNVNVNGNAVISVEDRRTSVIAEIRGELQRRGVSLPSGNGSSGNNGNGSSGNGKAPPPAS
jgi:hypothetical protein